MNFLSKMGFTLTFFIFTTLFSVFVVIDSYKTQAFGWLVFSSILCFLNVVGTLDEFKKWWKS